MIARWRSIPKQRKRTQFGSISYFGRSAVGFNQLDGCSFVLCLGIRTSNGLNLTALTWSSNAFSSSIRRTAHATNYSVNFVAVSNGIRKTLENKGTRPFSHYESVCTCIERRRVSRRKCSNCAELSESRSIHAAVGSSSNHDIHLTHLQQAAGIHEGCQRRCASGIHSEIRALQVQKIGNSTCNNIG